MKSKNLIEKTVEAFCLRTKLGKWMFHRLRYQGDRYQSMRTLYPTENPDDKLREYQVLQTKRVLQASLVLAGILILLVVTGDEKNLTDGTLDRRSPGEGAYQQELRADFEDGTYYDMTIDVEEQMLSEEEIKQLFESAQTELEEVFLGENASGDYVNYNLVLPNQAVDGLVDVEWTFDNYDVLHMDGAIDEDAPTEGTMIRVTAEMSYRGHTAEHIFPIIVYPPQLTEREALEKAIQSAVASDDVDSQEKTYQELPRVIAGMQVTWKKQGNLIAIAGGMGVLVIILILYEGKEKLKRREQERDRQLLMDYAQIVNNLYLLMSAGMSVYSAWERLVLTQDSLGQEKRYAYEEMKITYYQIKDGMSEGKAYEEFGRRCRLRPYLKLAAILTRNLRLGTAGIGKMLEEEAQEAFEDRKRQARRQGEEAGTKLLMPMMLLLCIVAGVILVPGYMSF